MSIGAARSLSWFARHEARLTWRDMLAMMTAGRRGRERAAAVWLLAFVVGLHVIAYVVLRNYAPDGLKPDINTLIGVTTAILLSGSAMLSQAMENVTRIFYTRSDLELILSAPVKTGRVFAVRIAAMSISAILMSAVLIGPFIDVLIWREGAYWLSAYGVLAVVSLITTALAVLLTVNLFRLIGPRRTRLAAQIAAAIVGGLFVIGLQSAAMFSSGTLSRASFLKSAWVLNHVPGPQSLIWAPARAALEHAVGRVEIGELRVAPAEQELVRALVGVAEKEHRVGERTVAAGAADLLVVALDRRGERGVDDGAHVRLVDAHAERGRGDDDVELAAQEAGLDVGADGGGETCVISGSVELVAERLRGLFRFFARGRVDDRGAMRGVREDRFDEIEPFARQTLDRFDRDVRAAEAVDRAER